MTSTTEAPDLFCADCGYSLRGIESDVCPECGAAIDRERLARSSIPWSYRREIGRGRAFVRTVGRVIRRPGELAREAARPVSLEDAMSFSRAVAWVAASVPMAGVVVAYVSSVGLRRLMDLTVGTGADARWTPAVKMGWALEIGVVPVAWVAVYLFFLGAGRVASYFFHPRRIAVERQNRAVALSHYACAPLALTPISVMAVVGAIVMVIDSSIADAVPLPMKALVGVIAAGIVLVQLAAAVIVPAKLMRGVIPESGARAWRMAVALPVLWVCLGIITAGIVAAYLFVALVVMSLVA